MRGLEHAMDNARAWAEQIDRYALASLLETWDRMDELKETLEATKHPGCTMDKSERDELSKLEGLLSGFRGANDAAEQAMGSVLDIKLSGEWAPGGEPKADGFIILLTTGGPALRIVGELDQRGEPGSAHWEVQDWGLPWTSVGVECNGLLDFCSLFYFGE